MPVLRDNNVSLPHWYVQNQKQRKIIRETRECDSRSSSDSGFEIFCIQRVLISWNQSYKSNRFDSKSISTYMMNDTICDMLAGTLKLGRQSTVMALRYWLSGGPPSAVQLS
jgi:hypothetical protein